MKPRNKNKTNQKLNTPKVPGLSSWKTNGPPKKQNHEAIEAAASQLSLDNKIFIEDRLSKKKKNLLTKSVKLHMRFDDNPNAERWFHNTAIFEPAFQAELKNFFHRPEFAQIARFVYPTIVGDIHSFKVRFVALSGARLPTVVFHAAELKVEQRVIYKLLASCADLTLQQALAICSRKPSELTTTEPVLLKDKKQRHNKSKKDNQSLRRVRKEQAWDYQSGDSKAMILDYFHRDVAHNQAVLLIQRGPIFHLHHTAIAVRRMTPELAQTRAQVLNELNITFMADEGEPKPLHMIVRAERNFDFLYRQRVLQLTSQGVLPEDLQHDQMLTFLFAHVTRFTNMLPTRRESMRSRRLMELFRLHQAREKQWVEALGRPLDYDALAQIADMRRENEAWSVTELNRYKKFESFFRQGGDSMFLTISCLLEKSVIYISKLNYHYVAFSSNINPLSTWSVFLLDAMEYIRSLIGHDCISQLLLELGPFLQGLFTQAKFVHQAKGEGLDMQDMFFFIVSLPFMPFTESWDTRIGWYNNCKKHYSKLGGAFGDVAFLKKIMGYAQWLITKGIECFHSGSLSPFYETTPWTDWLLRAKEHVRMEHSVGSAVDARDYMDTLTSLLSEGDGLISVLRTLDDRQGLSFILTAYESLRDISTKETILEAVRAARQPPFYIALVGPPKTGKSAIVDELCVEGYVALGKEYNTNLRYNRASTDKYDSGLRASHRIIVFDDLGAVNSDVGSEAMLAQLNLLMGLANDQASASIQADLKDKGKIFPQANLVIITSNLPSFGIDQYMTVPSAFFRRVRYKIVLTVRPAFRVSPDHNVLDVQKIAAAERLYPGYRDFHYFTVVEYHLHSQGGNITINNGQLNDPSLNVTVFEHQILVNATGAEFFTWYRQTISAHFADTLLMRGHATKLAEEHYCSHGTKPGRCSDCIRAAFTGNLPSFVAQGGALSRLDTIYNTTTSYITDGALDYFGSLAFRTLLRQRDRATLFAANIYRLTGQYLDSPEVQRVLKAVLASAFVMGISYACISTAHLQPSVSKVEVKLVEAFSPQADVVDSDSYRKAMAELSKGAPPDVYSKGVRDVPILLSDKSKSVSITILAKKVATNQGVFVVGSKAAVCTGICEDQLMTVSHLCPDLPCQVVLIFDGDRTPLLLHQGNVRYLNREKDILIFCCGFRKFKDLRPWIPISFSKSPVLDSCRFVHPIKAKENLVGVPFVYMNQRMIRVPINLDDGSCGGLLLAPIGAGSAIVGMQQYGNNSITDPASLMGRLTQDCFEQTYEESLTKLGVKPQLELQYNGLGILPDKPIESFHHKSYVHYRVFPQELQPICDIPYGVQKPSTKLEPTPLHGLITNCEKTIPDFFEGTRPDGTYVSPFNVVVDTLCDRRACYPTDLMEIAGEYLFLRFSELVRRAPGAYPLDEHQSLNGIDGVRFIDAFNKHTGQGLPKRGPKSEYIFGEDGHRRYNDAGRKAVNVLASFMSRHVNPGMICDITLKDELKKSNKAIRGFAAIPFAFNDIMRRLVLPLAKIIQENSLYFGIAIGTDADSYEWKHIYQKHLSFKYTVLFDFKDFDRSHMDLMLATANRVIMRLLHQIYPSHARVAGYLWHVLASCGFAMTQWPLYNVKNTVYQASGSLASGFFYTALVNSIIQLLIVKMLWIEFTKQNPEWGSVENFNQHVACTTYGDDGMVSTNAPGFGGDFFVKTASKWNLVITAPDKTQNFKSNYVPAEWTFLKRTFVPCERRGIVKAPLEIQSILKALNYWEKPTETSQLDALVERVNQAFLYLSVWETREADELYDEVTLAFGKLWPEQLPLLWSQDTCRKIKFVRSLDPQTYPLFNFCTSLNLHPNEFEKRFCRNLILQPLAVSAKTGGSSLSTTHRLLVDDDEKLGIEEIRQPTSGLDFVPQSRSLNTKWNANNNSSTAEGSGLSEPTIPISLVTESAPGANVMSADLVNFTSDAPGMDAGLPASMPLHDLSLAPTTATLGEWLRRPIEISGFDWIFSSASFHIDPWALYLNIPSVQDKIRFFRYLRGTLHISVQLNGTPFHYGRMMVSYEPCNFDRVSIDGDARQHSGCQHILMDPSTSNVANFSCPFVSPLLWIDRTGGNNGIDPNYTTGYQSAQTAGLGVLNFDILNTIRIFQGGTPAKVPVNVYAWFEDLEMAMPTTDDSIVAFVAQAGDEFQAGASSGVISRPAAMLARVAGRLSEVPIIGKFALATQMGVSTVGAIASMFGYSKPRMLEPPTVMLQTVTGNTTNTDVPDPAISLTFNAKSELSVGPGVSGYDPKRDEMAIHSFTGRWTFMHNMNWNRTQASGTNIMNIPISPMTFALQSNSPFLTQYPSSLSFASHPFDYWHGTIELRMIIVASRFHRGRLKIAWAPQVSANNELNKNYSHIVDISGTREYCISCPYVCVEGYKRVPPYTLSIDPAYNGVFHSGIIKVSVQNELVCPSDEPVYIMFYIRAGDDFRLAVPNENHTTLTIYNPTTAPSMAMADDETKLEEEFFPQSGSLAELGVAASVDCEQITFVPTKYLPEYDLAYMGDPVRSFRALVKRYAFVTILCISVTATVRGMLNIGYEWPLYPEQQRFTPNGLFRTTAVGGTPFVYTETHIASYISTCFLGKRGSFRTLIDYAPSTIPFPFMRNSLKVYRSNNTISYGAFTGATDAVSGPQVIRQTQTDTDGAVGLQLFSAGPTDFKPSVETPFYSPWRYVSAVSHGNLAVGGTVNPFVERVVGTKAMSTIYSGGTPPSTLIADQMRLYQAAGEDFNVIFYRGVPPQTYKKVWVVGDNIADSFRDATIYRP